MTTDTSMKTLLLTSLLALAGAAPAHAAVTLSSGHADYGARIVGGKLQTQVRYGAGDGKSVWREPSDVVVSINAKAQHALPKSNFLGNKGTRLWLIPQTQKRDVIWLGWSTEQVKSNQLRGGVSWTLEGVSGPGRVAVFTTGSFGNADVLFDSKRARPGTRTIPVGVHAHGNWAFTRAGTYKLRFKMSATSRAGRSLSDRTALTVRVR